MTIEAIAWLYPNLLARGEIIVLSGTGQSGKSAVTAHLVALLASAEDAADSDSNATTGEPPALKGGV